MRKPIEIGNKIFKTKKDALLHYKAILNSYRFGEELNKDDFEDVFALLKTHPKVKEITRKGIKTIKIVRLKYNTKSFELIKFDNSTEYFSYIKRINSPRSDFTRFSEACRQSINDDIYRVKQKYFDDFSKNGKVKCQETGKYYYWEDLVIDHRQPNTFSIIVDRFIEINQIDLKKVNYIEINGGQNKLADNNLKEMFIKYHREKANLRIVKKGLNSGRTFQARVKTQKKDLRIE